MEKVIKKPWGHESILESNDLYVVKQLFIRAGERLSLQYHEDKVETMTVVHGDALIDRLPLVCKHNSKPITESMELFKPYHITPKTIHRVTAKADTHIVEISSPQLDDVVRIEDDYGRCDAEFEVKTSEEKND